MELNTINKFLREIEYLKKKEELLESILRYYDAETMTFVIPDDYGFNKAQMMNAAKNNIVAKSPKHELNKQMLQLLPYSEHERLINWDKVEETL